MKLLLFLLVGVVVCQKSPEELTERKCVKDLNLDEKSTIMVSRESNTPIDIEMHGKYFLCVWKGRGVIDEKGSVVPEKIELFLSEIFFHPSVPDKDKDSIRSKVKELCSSIREEKEGHTAVKLKNCIVGIIKDSKILTPPTQ